VQYTGLHSGLSNQAESIRISAHPSSDSETNINCTLTNCISKAQSFATNSTMDSRIEPPFIPRYQPPTSQTYEPKDDELAEWAVDTNRPVSMDTSIPVDVSILPPFALSKIPSPLDHDKPTCTLKLICYRPGKQGYVWRWIKVYSQSRYAALPHHALQHYKGLERDTSLVRNDLQFFRSLQKEYKNQLCGPWRRCFSLKTLRQIRLLSVCTHCSNQ
jgi:hypothetical protein